ncbi:sensor histidine kinase [Dyella solisilvae]|uniref:Oxygen sensor histidine kinase NreB n=1 Tax=Dyella solisilvae TaxID=1920168 RepID=A0A370KA18_9GAMM|nr:ATP-binding protein [Dyella solisilvae]RDI99491.1 sensor histidine kinase [Dyella solisilvae]
MTSIEAPAVGSLPYLVRGAGMFVAALVAQWVSLLMWNHPGDALMIWLSGPLLLGVLLSEPAKFRWVYGAAWLLGLVALTAVVGLPLAGMLPAFLCALLLVNLAAHVLSRFRQEESIDDFLRLLGYLVIAVVLLPLASALLVTAIASRLPMPSWLGSSGWWHVALADSLGYVLVSPAIVSLANPGSTLRRDALPSWDMLLATIGGLVLLWLVWRELGGYATARPLLLLAPVPLAIFVALRAQIPGTCVVNLLMGAIAIQLSLEGEGPFAQSDSELTAVSVQLWMLGIAVATLFLAALVEQRRATQRALSMRSTEVRELAGRLIVAQEQERARIARDLHDDINQRLAVASIRLSALRRKVDESNRQDVSQLQSDLIALSEDVRHLSHDLHPSMLAQTGLTAALAGLCQAQRHRSGPAIDLKVSPQAKDLSEEVSLCLYRVTQEALGNAVRHADAQHVEIALQIEDDRVDLTVADDGKGFVTEGDGRKGLGLMSIDERTKLLGGSYRLNSTLGKGTELCICIPLGPSRPLHGQA